MNPDANGHRLPTEAEWEYACRAGTESAFFAGEITQTSYTPPDPNLDAAGWYVGNSWNPQNSMLNGRGTHIGGRKQANRFGLHDMHGNVWEWCQDWFGDYAAEATDPTGPTNGTFRVSRGGGWTAFPESARAASRTPYTPHYDTYTLGFRTVRTATP